MTLLPGQERELLSRRLTLLIRHWSVATGLGKMLPALVAASEISLGIFKLHTILMGIRRARPMAPSEPTPFTCVIDLRYI